MPHKLVAQVLPRRAVYDKIDFFFDMELMIPLPKMIQRKRRSQPKVHHLAAISAKAILCHVGRTIPQDNI
jgi:hypothetical protein